MDFANRKRTIVAFWLSLLPIISLPFGCKTQSHPESTTRIDQLKKLSDQELTQKDSLGRTYLHWAAIEDDTSSISLLYHRNFDFNQKDNSGYTALHEALKYRHIHAFRKILELGADPKIEFPDTLSVAMHALHQGDPLFLEPLYLAWNRNYKIIKANEYYSLALEAVRRKKYSIAEMLIWPLHYVVKRNKTEYFEHLVNADKSLLSSRDQKEMTPLHIANLYKNENLIRLLKQAGARDTMDVYGNQPEAYQNADILGKTEINLLDERTRANLEDKMLDFLMHHDWLTLGVIKDGKIVYLKSYGQPNMIDQDAVHASVSKIMTAVIFAQLVNQGIIKSPDEPISKYSLKYRNVMPQKFTGDSITFRQILNHSSGIPHLNNPLWVDKKLNLLFKPGTKTEYSSHAFGVLGEVMAEATGKSFPILVKEYIGQPIGAKSFWAENEFRAPAARIHSTSRDFARFAEGIINNSYLPETVFDSLLIGNAPGKSLGWGAGYIGTQDLTIGHSGSNGKPRSHIIIKPKRKDAVLLMGSTKEAKSDIWFMQLAPILMEIIEGKGYY